MWVHRGGGSCFLLQGLVAGSLEGTSDCTKALLLDLLQGFPNPLSLCQP